MARRKRKSLVVVLKKTWWMDRGYWCYLSFGWCLFLAVGVALGAGTYLLASNLPWWAWLGAWLVWVNAWACYTHGLTRNCWALVAGLGRDRYPMFLGEYWGRGILQLVVIAVGLIPWVLFGACLVLGWLVESYQWLGLASVLVAAGWWWQWYLGLTVAFLGEQTVGLRQAFALSWRTTCRHKLLLAGLLLLAYLLIIGTGLVLPAIGVFIGISMVLSITFVIAHQEFARVKN